MGGWGAENVGVRVVFSKITELTLVGKEKNKGG